MGPASSKLRETFLFRYGAGQFYVVEVLLFSTKERASFPCTIPLLCHGWWQSMLKLSWEFFHFFSFLSPAWASCLRYISVLQLKLSVSTRMWRSVMIFLYIQNILNTSWIYKMVTRLINDNFSTSTKVVSRYVTGYVIFFFHAIRHRL